MCFDVVQGIKIFRLSTKVIMTIDYKIISTGIPMSTIFIPYPIPINLFQTGSRKESFFPDPWAYLATKVMNV